MEDCIFCRIARGEVGAEKILETARTVSFMDINPRAIGHILVITKGHVVKLAELDDETVAEIFKATRDVVRMLDKAFKPDAFTIGINDGKEAGQEIPHLHVNIIPRFAGDGGKAIHSVVNNPPGEDVRETARKIKAS